MRLERIAKIGDKAFSRSIHPLTRSPIVDAAIVGFDTEYTSKGHKLLCFQLYGKKGLLVQTSNLTVEGLIKGAWRSLESTPKVIYLITFFSLAELQFLNVKKDAFDIREYARGSLDCSFYSSKLKVTIRIFDLARWFDFQSLANAAKSFGLAKQEYDTTRVTKSSLSDLKFRKYAIHDAYLSREICHILRSKFLEKGVDIFEAETPANTSAKIFRMEHVESKICCDNNRARYASLLGYWGGRAEVFYRGKVDRVFEYDISSAYPTSAIQLGYLPVQGSWRESRSLHNFTRSLGGFARVRFSYPESEQYPSLPVECNKFQLYPTRGETWATREEIEFALERGCKIEMKEGWHYHDGTTILKDYMQDLLEKRKNAVGAERVALKLQANSLIGKFAQQTEKISPEQLRKCAQEHGLEIDELVDLSRSEREAFGLKAEISIGSVWMPDWAGLVMGHTRTRLARMLVQTNALYCATDAVWTAENIKCPNGWELKRSGPATIVRTRLAAIWGKEKEEDHVVFHSIWSRKAGSQIVKKFVDEDFSRKYIVSRPLKFKESVKKKRSVGVWVEEWRSGNTRWDGKRKLLANGETRPWRDIKEYEQTHTRNR